MVTDARGHIVPSGSEAPKRQALLDLSDSINDVRPVADKTAGDALVASLAADDIDPAGLVCWFATPGSLAYYTGSAWIGVAPVTRLPYGAASGIATIPTHASTNVASVTVTYPAGRFTKPPAVVASASTSFLNASVSPGITTTSAQITVRRIDNQNFSGGSYTARWIAQQDGGSSSLLVAAEEAAELDVVVTCPTSGCGNESLPILIQSVWMDDDGESRPVTAVDCGACGTDITDTLTSIGS